MTASLIPTQTLTDPSEAAALLKAGQLVAFATETVYGLGADATNGNAVAQVFEAKNRPKFDPLIVHVPDIAAAKTVTQDWTEMAQELAHAFWPGPLTLVLPRRNHISDLVTAGLPGVGIRVPAHPMARDLLGQFGGPIVAPSANLFGLVSPTSVEHVLEGLYGRIAAVLDGGPCEVGVESTVVSLMNDRPVLLRPGGLPIEVLQEVAGPIEVASPNVGLPNAAQPAPGMLSRHYAPSTPLHLLDSNQLAVPVKDSRCGLLTYSESGIHTLVDSESEFETYECVGDRENLETCATNFFAALRSLDAAGLDVIIARKFPDHGLGVALNDRLKRAAAR